MHVVPFDNAGVRGFLHRPSHPNGAGMVLTHGAGSDCNAPLLIAGAEAFTAAGIHVLRCDLPFRQARPAGPPSRASGPGDRAGLRRAVEAMRSVVSGPIVLSGHSYGGRQASILAADEPDLADALLLLSYPLHPPRKPEILRTEHFPRLSTRTIFVHGTADAFATVSELEAAAALIPASTGIVTIAGAGHDLRRGRFDFTPLVTALTDGRQ